MKKIIFLLSLFFLAAFNGRAQSWEKLFSGISTDVFRCVIEVPSGGFIAAGYTADSTVNDTDGYVVRLNTLGDTIWTFRYNGPMSRKDLFYKVINTIDGGFALCGYTSSVTGTQDDLLYLKLNSTGQQQWVKFYGGSGRDRGQDIIQTADGKYTIVGYTTSPPAQYYDAFMIRTSSTGDTLWTKRYGESNYDDANCVQVLADGGFILGGQSNNGPTNGLDQFLIRTNSTGDTLWTRRFGGPNIDNIDCVRLVSGGFIIAGSRNNGASGDDGSIVKTDTFGIVQWSKTYGGSLPDDFHRIEPTTGGGFVATGTTTSSGPALPNMWMVRINSTGDTLWTRTFGGANHDHGYSGQQTSDGGYIIAGHTGSFGFNNEDGYIVKTDGSGNVSNHMVYTTVLAIVSPNASTCGNAATQIILKLRNFGNQFVPNMPVTVEISGALTQTISQTFSASSDTVTLTTTINTTAGGTYTFKCYTNNGNDVYPERNSMTRTFTIGVTAANPGTTSNARCGNGTVGLSASGAGTLYWYPTSSGGSSIFTGTNYTTPPLSTTTTYYVQANLVCPSSRIPVTATINPISPDPVVTDDSRCGPGVLNLSATDPDSMIWYDAPTAGNVVGTGPTFNTPSLSVTTNYYVMATNLLCPSNRVLAVATISSVAADPVTTSTQRCGTGSDTLLASSSDPVVWYTASSGGSPVGNGLSFITPSVANTTTYYAEADNGCVSNRVPATLTINPLATAPLTFQDQNCGPGVLTLTATASDPISWIDSSGNVVGSGTTFNTPLISSTTFYSAVTFNGTCPSNPVATAAVIFAVPAINLGNDTSVNALSFFIDAGPGFTGYAWSTGETTQSITITNPDTFCVTVTNATGCTNSDCIFVDLFNGVKDIPSKNTFLLYPNPANEQVTIEFAYAISDSEIEILNLTGKVLKRITSANAENLNLDLSTFAKGIYFVRIKTGNYSEMQKLIIQ